jgi:uncharacterized protein (DUF1015 family)
MADIRAFRGWRYNLARVGELSGVVAPPYDVIDPDMERRLLDRHPANIVRVELGKEPPGGVANSERYAQASRFLHGWKLDGTLIEDSAPAIYVVHQKFEIEGTRYVRRGFLARIRVEPFGAGQIYPHEETMAGPKADRLKLYHATGMNVSPIFSMFPDRDGRVQDLLEDVGRGRTPLEAVDQSGVVSSMWPLADQELVSRLRGWMSQQPIFIADGHHRYETAVRYLEDRRAAGVVRDDDAPENFCLMMFVAMSDPGLVILPTHRLVSGLAGLDSAALQTVLADEFEVDAIGDGPAGCRAAWELIEAAGDQNTLGFGTVADGQWLVARLRNSHTMERLVPQHSPEWRGLGVSILHELVVQHLLSSRLGGVAPGLKYVHLISEVTDTTAAGSCDLACLVPAATMNHVQQIAVTGERMPAKSTYFYPKLLTGLVLNPIA